MRKKRLGRLFIAICAFSLILGISGKGVSAAEADQQSNAINMLNYLRMFAQEIQASSGSRLYVEEAYASLINNTNPNAIDQPTLDQVLDMLDILENLRMMDVTRDRVEFIYNQGKANTLRSLLPSPVGMLNITEAMENAGEMNSTGLAIAYAVVSAGVSYLNAVDEADESYLNKEWELSTEEADQIHSLRKSLYAYMVNTVNSYDLDGKLALNEESVDSFVQWMEGGNLQRKLQFLEANEETYLAFAPYWLELANCYFENEDYEKCLDAIAAYEDLNIQIFRKDYDLAETLPIAIAAAQQVYDADKAVDETDRFCRMLLANTNDSQWELRLVCAQTLYNLYEETGEEEYLDRSYDIELNNVNSLVEKQRVLNKAYMSDSTEADTPDGATKAQKSQIKKFNEMAKERRKTELVPVYEPIMLNCDFLFLLADEKGISDQERSRIDEMIHGDEEELFLSAPIEQLYKMDAGEIDEDEVEITFEGDELTIPVQFVTDTTQIEVTIEGEETIKIDDWELTSVKRPDEDDFSTFIAIYESDMADDVDYEGEEQISISIIPRESSSCQALNASFTAIREKRVGVLDTWDWLDDASKWSDVVSFERVFE